MILLTHKRGNSGLFLNVQIYINAKTIDSDFLL